MNEPKEELRKLLDLIEFERQEERAQYRERFLNTPLDKRREQGYTWYPVVIESEEIGLGDRLVIEVARTEEREQPGLFSTGAIASLWSNADPKRKSPPFITGVIIKSNEKMVRMALDPEELPDWVDEGKLGLDLYYDERSFNEMDKAVRAVIDANRDRLADLRDIILGKKKAGFHDSDKPLELPGLNSSQVEAVQNLREAKDLAIIHGPPGTGKTTTLVQAVKDTLRREKQVMVCAPSNLAVDLLTERLAQQGVRVLRLGHPARVSEAVLEHSLDRQVAQHDAYKDMKNLRKAAESVRRQALKFKRKFGREERERRKELLGEARDRKREARALEEFILKDLLNKATAITCTLAGSANSMLKGRNFSTLFIDEAAQALEPLCWVAISKAKRVVFAGDHCQLPPTVKSKQAEKGGLSITLFEKAIERQEADVMLRTQYRMHEQIMAFSNSQFYQGMLEADPGVAGHLLGESPTLSDPIEFVDTAGCGFEEKQNPETLSLYNVGEADILLRHLDALVAALPTEAVPRIGLISPYKDQVRLLRREVEARKSLDRLRSQLSVDTVDGFQGQERDAIYISLVRSNPEGQIGFLGDIRRMNVAMTRAKKKLVVIGDSATLANNRFFADFLAFVEKSGAYKSAWEFMEY